MPVSVKQNAAREGEGSCMSNSTGLSPAPTSSLFWLQVPVDNAKAVQVVESQSKLSKIELDIIFSEHNLRACEVVGQVR